MPGHEESCRAAIMAVREVLAVDSDEGVSNEIKLCWLSSVLQNQSAGQSGAGLTGGQQQESLWIDLLTLGDSRFTRHFARAAVQDADYYFEGYPLSHKTISWNGTGDLALAWSKNPPGGVQRTVFRASMAIALTRRPTAGKWGAVANGYYIVPLDYLERSITFASNNKTDSLIPNLQVIDAIRYAASLGLWVPLRYDHAWGRGKNLSYWGAGLRSILERAEGQSHEFTLE